MRSLRDFVNSEQRTLFNDATTLPQFFEHNLLDPARVVKVFYNDPQANIRVFYYEYLKLCFELDTVDYEGYINKIEQVINNEGFKFIFYQDDDPSIFTDNQFKQLLTEFFGMLGQATVSIQEALNRYPIMDTVLIYFFRSILILTGTTDTLDSYIERGQLLQFLTNYFGVEISLHDKCIKFVETDIFVYEDDPKEVYMAYMDYDKTQPQQDYQQIPTNQISEAVAQRDFKGSQQLSNKVPSQAPFSSSSQRGTNQVNQSYISNEFVDYTHTGSNLTNLVHPSNLKQSGNLPETEKNTYKPGGQTFEYSTQEQTKRSEELIPIIISPSQTSKNYETTPSYTDSYAYSSQTASYNQDFTSFNIDKGLSQPATDLTYGIKPINSDTPISSKNQQSKVSNSYDWQPTKDPGFQQKITTTEQDTPIADYQKPPSIPKYESPSYPPYQSSSNMFTPIQTAQTANYQSFKYVNVKPPSSEQSKPSSMVPSYTSTVQNFYNSTPTSSVPSGKNPFNLNVSLQFTNSITMKAMSEPFKSNVRNIRQRARDFRNSLKSFLK